MTSEKPEEPRKKKYINGISRKNVRFSIICYGSFVRGACSFFESIFGSRLGWSVWCVYVRARDMFGFIQIKIVGDFCSNSSGSSSSISFSFSSRIFLDMLFVAMN